MAFDPHLLAMLVPASLALNFYPGPNNIFALVNAARFGIGEALRAATGRIAAYALLVVVLACGGGAAIIASPVVYAVLRVAGALFLVWLGIKLLRQPAGRVEVSGAGAVANRRQLQRDEFRVAFANPKPVIVLLPFLEQLVAPADAISPGVAMAGAIVLALELVAAASYAAIGTRMRAIADTESGRRVMSKAGGVSVLLTAAILALAGIK